MMALREIQLTGKCQKDEIKTQCKCHLRLKSEPGQVCVAVEQGPV